MCFAKGHSANGKMDESLGCCGNAEQIVDYCLVICISAGSRRGILRVICLNRINWTNSILDEGFLRSN